MPDTRRQFELVILDRDGVINHDSDAYIKAPEEWLPIDGSAQAIALLNRAGYRVAVATNQSGLARGYYDEATLRAIHEKMRHTLAAAGAHLDDLRYCPHGPDDGCACRKPKPGMLSSLLEAFAITPEHALFVGDTLGDYQAAKALGMAFALVRSGKGERTLARNAEQLSGVPTYDNLLDLVSHLPGCTTAE